ncbi:MAG: TonB-dependent receptor [Methylovulum sp.]|nr:TonB-dependent receptor [Methylovulum sp.]
MDIIGSQILAVVVRQRWLKTLSVLVLLVYSQGLWADCDASFDDLLKLPLEQLLETGVGVASKVSTDPDKQPASVTVVTHEQLQLSGARTLSEALTTYVPGFFTVEDQDDTIASFRGLAADNNSKVMMLLNGHNLNAEWFMGPPDAILNGNSFDWIERIEVIRGPGSVTLGQGALLGVINIVTRNAEQLVQGCKQSKANLLAGAGLNNAWQGGMEYAFNNGSHDAYLHISENDYDGQALRDEGWAESKAFLGSSGGFVADAGHRLKRSDNLSLFGHFRYQKLNIDVLHTDQTRDLYNFYYDRDQLEQSLTYIGLSHRWDIHPGVELDTKADVTVDDYTLHSVMANAVSGGTRENRYGLQAVLRLKDLWQGNTLALGSEFHQYDLGENNANGDNFIVNIMSDQNRAMLDALKQSNTFVYPNNIDVYSLFAEDNYVLNDSLTLFGGIRYDHHKNWGENLSPRLGFFYYPWQDGQFRVSYSQGFRGAVGLNYSGGFRNDGLLSEGNFDKVSRANIPGYENLSAIQPEKLETFELAFNQHFSPHWQWENVVFYNQVKNIIGVAAIHGNDLGVVVPPIGSDVPGSANNYWFFKNNDGSIDQLGFEASLHYVAGPFHVTASHAYVDVLSVSQQNIGSMYITKTGQLRATPQNVTRLNITWHALQQVSFGVNYLYYSDWYATTGMRADGGHLLSAGVLYSPWERLELSLSVKNILGENNLYPMNNNANSFVSPGTPALEATTFWLKAKLSLL